MSQPGRVTRQTADRFLDCLEQAKGDRREAGKLAGIKERRSYQVLQAIKAEFPDLAERLATIDVDKAVRRSQTAAFPAPEGHAIKGVSTLHGPDGEVKAQWVKTTVDADQRRAAAEAAVRALCEKIQPQAPLPAPAVMAARLCTVYTLTDCHVGMLAWRREGGDDWDLKIAETTLLGCLRAMIAAAPPSAVGIVNNLGDFLHTDGLTPVTPAHGHVLDADSRFQKIVESAVRILRCCVNLALEKHASVVVYMCEGNHDESSSVWLRVLFAALYENEPRVRVEQSPLPYVAYQHGKTMLAFHHGHKKKPNELPAVFAAQFPEVWGGCKKRYVHIGHRHHVSETEHPGMLVVQHPTLAARDAYAARGGWLSWRQSTAMTYDTEHGEVGRVTVCPEMLEAAA